MAGPWGSPKREEMAVVIAAAGGDALTATEVAALVDRNVSNVATALEALTDAGLLDAVDPPPRPEGRRGNWPNVAYVLSDHGRTALDESTQPSQATAPPPAAAASARIRDKPSSRPSPTGALLDGSHLVFAAAEGDSLPEILHTLADCDAVTRASWAGVLGQEYVVAFAGDRAASDAGELVAVLTGARIPARHAVVSEIADSGNFLTEIRSRAAAARRARLARDTREAS